MVRRLVAFGDVTPHLPRDVEIAGPHPDDLAGLIPVSRWSWIMAQTCRETYGRMASICSSGTGLTGAVSLASVRPLLRPETAFRP
jgi:hypothetical protein